jgi:hypothetical protein
MTHFLFPLFQNFIMAESSTISKNGLQNGQNNDGQGESKLDTSKFPQFEIEGK